ncbi:Coiled-coil domain-containing protein 113 [Habropoda laboriosa]|uniref:Cilia- and flagella-associated protein 263 n=1 Tax=Habropoda laboriosa TaxID=597456 RepID=A0A0L7R664_9HYME|nr:Coiled-coil domain-containing protein 113 [Habropoda laboriosa]
MSIRDSIQSISSRRMQKHDDEINYDVMTMEEMQQMQDNLLQKIWMLSLENDVYERYLNRQDPQIIRTITNILERAKITRRVTGHLVPRSSRMSFRESIANLRGGSKHSIATASSAGSLHSLSRFGTPSLLTVGTYGEATKLVGRINFYLKIKCLSCEILGILLFCEITMAHRMAMAKKELEQLKKKLDHLKQFARKREEIMRAEIEEIEIRINEAHETKEEFEEEVVVKGVDPITGKIPAERVTRFFEDWLRSANTIIERLRLKSATARTQIRKARRQLAQREELGESLHAVDFEKLNIENQDYVKMLEEKSVYVIDMKKIAGHYHLKLTQHKQKLNDLLFTLNAVKREILLKQKQIEELEDEHVAVNLNRKRMSKQLETLLNFMDNYIAPDIQDFVELQEQYAALQRTYKLLQRRRNIEKIIYEAYRKQIQIRKKSSDHPKRRHEESVGHDIPDNFLKIATYVSLDLAKVFAGTHEDAIISVKKITQPCTVTGYATG